MKYICKNKYCQHKWQSSTTPYQYCPRCGSRNINGTWAACRKVTHCVSVYTNDKGKSYCGKISSAKYNPKPTCEVCKRRNAEANKGFKDISKALRGIMKHPDRTVRM